MLACDKSDYSVLILFDITTRYDKIPEHSRRQKKKIKNYQQRIVVAHVYVVERKIVQIVRDG